MGLFDNFSGSPLTASNPQFSAVQKPDFSISLDIGKSSGFGQGLFPQPTFGETKPQTQAEWAKQQFSNRLDQQAQDFHSNLQNTINPQKKDFDPTKWGMTDYAQQFSDMAQPFLQQNKLRTGLMLQQSNDPGTQLLGKVQADEAIADATKTPGWASGNSTVNERSFSDKFSNSTFGKNFGVWSAGLGMADTVLTGIMGEKSEYAGPKGDLTRSMDGVYDTIQQAAGNFGPYGQLISYGMQANKMLGNIANKLGGGTDGMTTTDAIMGSAFMQLSPFGLINGFGGKRADTITKDEEAFAQVGSSYGGTSATVDEALEKSGKKYGLFSSGARNKANDEISEAKRQQAIMTDIGDAASDRFAIKNSMSAINGNRKAFAMRGGYDQSAVRVGRNGLSIPSILAAKRAASAFKYRAIGKAKDPFEYYLSTLPQKQRSSKNFRVRDYWEFNGRPKDFNEAVSKGMFTQQEDGWHAKSVSENPETGEIEFMKSSSHPNHHMEVDWYYSDDGSEFRSQYELQKTEPYWKYVKRKPQGEAVGSYQEGGILEPSLSNIEEKHLEYISTIEEVSLDCILPEFKEGGKVNVIPEGALHARLHHMENAENLTKKGIPVVSEKEGGELEQQAEIEKEEIIFRLEVTKKLEDLYKIYYSDNATNQEKDEAAIEAGKLLVYETLYNTQDNTGILNKIN